MGDALGQGVDDLFEDGELIGRHRTGGQVALKAAPLGVVEGAERTCAARRPERAPRRLLLWGVRPGCCQSWFSFVVRDASARYAPLALSGSLADEAVRRVTAV
jgi:hypothetical protein